jgi:hypothetical protein
VLEEDEELELLNFAENLDFDSFVEKLEDVEMQQALKVSGVWRVECGCGLVGCGVGMPVFGIRSSSLRLGDIRTLDLSRTVPSQPLYR